jgi:PilZ domain
MTLSSMLVSRDWPEVSVLECILGSLHIGVDVEAEVDRAQAKLGKAKIDALIVDCDLEGSASFLRRFSAGINSVPLVIISGAHGRTSLKGIDASFVFEKPISVEQAVRTLSAARNMILDGRLRYHRQALDLPVSISYGRKRLRAQLLNLSQGGLGILLPKPVSLTGEVSVDFALPGKKTRLKAMGEVVWTRQERTGIRFVEMAPQIKQSLQLWLARQYLTR